MYANQEFDTPSDALAHYGRKGMRWGHREPADQPGAPVARRRIVTKKRVVIAGLVGAYAVGYGLNKGFDKTLANSARAATRPGTYKFMANAGINATQGAAKVTNATGKGAYKAVSNPYTAKAGKLAVSGTKKGGRSVGLAAIQGSASIGKGAAFITRKGGSGTAKVVKGAFKTGAAAGDTLLRVSR